MKPVLGYWDSRGVGEPIRILLHYAGVDFEDKRYYLPDTQPYDKSDWFKDRDSLGLLYPNLPYYIEGDVKITQSVAILRFLARKHGLMPTNEADLIRAEILEQQCKDLAKRFIAIFFQSDYDEAHSQCLQSLPQSLKYLSQALGNRKWFAQEDKLSYVDIMIWEVLDHYKYLFANEVNSVDNLSSFNKRFESLPAINKYVNSDKFKSTRLYRFTDKSPKRPN